MSLIKQQINQIDALFKEYFNEYYLSHREVKNISFLAMKDSSGYSVILEYENTGNM